MNRVKLLALLAGVILIHCAAGGAALAIVPEYTVDEKGIHLKGIGPENPILYDNDWWFDVFDNNYLWTQARLKAMTDASQCFTPIRQMIERINRMLQGWQRYFSQGYPAQAYRDVDSYTLRRLRQHLRRRSQRAYKNPEDVTWWDHLQRLGWSPLQKRQVYT